MWLKTLFIYLLYSLVFACSAFFRLRPCVQHNLTRFASAYNIHYHSFGSVDGNMAELKNKLDTNAVTVTKKFVDWGCHYAYSAISVVTTSCVAAAGNMLLHANLLLHLLLCEHCLLPSSSCLHNLCRTSFDLAGVCTPAAIGWLLNCLCTRGPPLTTLGIGTPAAVRFAAQLLVCA